MEFPLGGIASRLTTTTFENAVIRKGHQKGGTDTHERSHLYGMRGCSLR